MLQKFSISNKCCFINFLFIKESWKKMHQGFHKNMEQHNFFQHVIRNDFWAANRHIRMIYEGSRDTEDWSNNAENSALITGINYIFNIMFT